MAFYSPYQFALFRFLFGLFLAFVLIGYLLGAPDLFLPDAFSLADEAQTRHFAAFHILRFFQSGTQVQLYLGFLTILALLLSFGVGRRWVAFVLWFGWIGLFFTQGRVESLHVFFVEWLLFVCVVARSGEGWAFHRLPTASWRLSDLLFWGSWFILALGLFMMGYQKMSDPAWRDGTVMMASLESLFSRDWFLVWGLRSMPGWAIQGISWLYGSFLIAFPFLCLWRPLRRWSWGFLLGTLCVSLMVFSTAVETLAFLALVFFVFDRRWFVPEAGDSESVVVFFDGDQSRGRSWADFLCAEDVAEFLKFAPLGGKTADKKLGEDFDEKPTVLVSDSGRLLCDADALTLLFKKLGGPWRILAGVGWVPAGIGNFLFRLGSGCMSLYTGDKISSESSSEKRRRFLN